MPGSKFGKHLHGTENEKRILLPADVLLTVNLFTIFHNEVQLRHMQKF